MTQKDAVKNGHLELEKHYDRTLGDVEKWVRGKKLKMDLRGNEKLQAELKDRKEWWVTYLDQLRMHK